MGHRAVREKANCYANRRVDNPVVVDQRQAEILDMIKATGKATNRDVATRFQISDTSTNRLLAGMTGQGPHPANGRA